MAGLSDELLTIKRGRVTVKWAALGSALVGGVVLVIVNGINSLISTLGELSRGAVDGLGGGAETLVGELLGIPSGWITESVSSLTEWVLGFGVFGPLIGGIVMFLVAWIVIKSSVWAWAIVWGGLT